MFGNTQPAEDVDGDGSIFIFNMRLPGQRWDGVAELSNNYYREYDPSIGRFSQSDPIGLNGGASTYAYVFGSPNSLYDPLGLAACRGLEKKSWLNSYVHSIPTGDSERVWPICVWTPAYPWVPGPIDYVPDPYDVSRRKFPMGLPVSIEVFCGWIWRDRMRLERVQRWKLHRFEECTDDCGNKTVRELHHMAVYGKDVELIKYFNYYWRDTNMKSEGIF